MLSIWQKESFYFTTDIIVAGGGLTGLITAILLKERYPHKSVRLLERGPFPSGASVKNAGFACFGSVSEILSDIESEGESIALGRVLQRYEGLQQLFALTEGTHIGYREDGGFEIFGESEADLYQQSLDGIDSLNNLLQEGLGFKPFSSVPDTFGFRGMPNLISIAGEGSLHSGKLVSVLLQKAAALGVLLNFGAEVKSVENTGSMWKVNIEEGSFTCEKVIVATNGSAAGLLPREAVLPYRGQLVLTTPINDLKLKGNFHLMQGYFYFRPYEGGILLGGGRHLDRMNENTDSQETTQVIQQALENLLRTTIIPGVDFQIRERWAGTMAFGPKNEKEAIVKEVEPGYYLGARLGGMGVAMASKVADRLVQLAMA